MTSINPSLKRDLTQLFEQWAGEAAQRFSPLPPSGSYREYYRIGGDQHTALGVYNRDRKENIAFLTFSKYFYNKGLAVPEIYEEALDRHQYLLQDLGDTTLFSHLTAVRQNGQFPDELVKWYKRVLEELPHFQILDGEGLNYAVCYPRSQFDKQSMLWDLNYFKYYFLKLAKISFDEQALEDDFQTFTNFLLQADCHYFLYRDFQSRNIMLVEDRPYFIDYQGGRQGALQYDVASLLYDAKADIPLGIRLELLDHYIENVSRRIRLDLKTFREHYYGYVLIRMMQAMGAFGFRGFYEKKEHFLQSVPYAIKNLEWLLETVRLPVEMPEITHVLNQLVDSEDLKRLGDMRPTFTIRINSFSYRRGIPIDESGNGGGYVFDCRTIHNPGRYEQYKFLTGKDVEVIEFFHKETDVETYLQHIYALVEHSVNTYRQRNLRQLMVNFGCTGGQHRSVYCAERLAEHLRATHDVKIVLRHIEQEMKE